MEQEVQHKLDKVRRLMSERGLEAMLFYGRPNFSWITGGEAPSVDESTGRIAACAAVTGDLAYVVADKAEIARLNEDSRLEQKGFELVTRSWFQGLPDPSEYGARNAVGADTLMCGAIYLGDQVAPLRYELEPEEIERYRWLGSQLGKALEEVARCVEPGMTEHKIASLLAVRLVDSGITPVLTLIATDGRNIGCSQPVPTYSRMAQYATMAVSGSRWGLVANATRMVCIGPIPDDVRAWHDAATQIDAAAIAATHAGRAVSDVYHEIVKAYAGTDYPDEWQKHHLGGATGYLVRDYLATGASKEIIGNNQAFAWNPSVHGMRTEDTIIAVEDGPDIITQTGNWPMRSIRVSDGTDIVRPDILVR